MSHKEKKRGGRVWGPGMVITIVLLLLSIEFIGLLFFTKLVPNHLLIAGGLILLTVVLLICLLTNDLRKKLRFFLGAILAILLIIGLVVGNLYVISTYNTLVRISDVNTKTSAIGVYVLTDDPAQSIEDARNYTFGKLSNLDLENTANAVDQIQNEVGQGISTADKEGLTELVDALRSGECGALILNHAYVPVIEEMEGYENIESEIREISLQLVEESLDTKAGEDAAQVVQNEDVLQLFISGIDTRGSELIANSRSDVNIVATINTKTHQVLLVSTPRDYFVPLSISDGARDKLTHAGIYGVDCSMDTLGMLYGYDINNYFRVNFVGFVDIIDALGGITVNSDYDFTVGDFSYVKGANNLSGIEALAFARERHAFAEGDRQRGKNQMAVIEGVIQKMLTPEMLKNYTSIMDAVEGSFDTNVPYSKIAELVRHQLEDNSKWTIIRYSVDGEGASEVPYSMSSRAYVMIPDETTVNKAKSLMDRVINNEIITQSDAQ